MKHRYLPVFFGLLFIMAAYQPESAAAQVAFQARPSRFLFPDTSETRMLYQNDLDAPLFRIDQRTTRLHSQQNGIGRVQYRVISEPDAVYQLFIPEQNNRFPIARAGTYIIKRDRASGEFEQVKIFLRSDEQFFVRIFPDEVTGSRMDVVMAGDTIHQSLRVPVPFHRVLIDPFDILVGVTSRLVEWEQFDARFDADIDGRIQDIRREYAETGRMPDVFRSTTASRIIEIDSLRSGLYTLYMQEPGSVITGTVFPTEFRRSEQLLPETGVFFPYLDENGVFRIASFVGSRPVSVQSLVVQFSGDYLHAEILKPDAFVF